MEEHRLSYVTKLIPYRSIQLLDFGFGSAKLETKLSGRDQDLTIFGVDISPLSVEKASKKFPAWHFLRGNGNKLKFESDFFDYVVALEVFEHISPRDIFKTLREVHRVMKREGVLIVSVPINEGLEEMIIHGRNPNSHVRAYTKAILETELYIAGFKTIKSKYLYAFNKFYKTKNLLVTLLPTLRDPNNLILVAIKSK